MSAPNWKNLQVLIMDVDGVLTEGGVEMSAASDEDRCFHIRDGCAIKIWSESNGRSALLSGRKSVTVARRAEALGISLVRQGVHDKLGEYASLCRELGVEDGRVCYIGDDLPDLAPMKCCAFAAAPADAAPSVRRIADYVSLRDGGRGAVAEIIELILRKQQVWVERMRASC